MSDYKLTEALEYRLMNAWPSIECQFYRGWVVRFANGYTKRANSVSPLWHDAELDDELVTHIIEQFDAMGIRPVFRLTGLEKAGTDEILAAHGFVESDPTYCMVTDDLARFEVEDAVTISTELPPEWAQDAVLSQEQGVTPEVLRDIVTRIRQTHGFATLSMDDQAVAWGLGVVERGYIGLYDVVVQPDLRGLGLGKRVLNGLIAWGREHGAQHAYLQVTEANTVARSLYSSLGFRDAYRYRHRILKQETPAQPVDDSTEGMLPISG